MATTARNFFSATEKESIKNAIRQAELKTSGEIRVHVENRCKGDVLNRASYLFGIIGMHKTQQRNGVLFYLAIAAHKFAIIGDVGINVLVPADFWDSTKKIMLEHFSTGAFAEGLIKGITMAGEQLKSHFPYQKEDVNELSDDISFGKGNK
ncbi:MAG: TPM domain-containing protein [Bacteroidetes bacterium]|nr:TPM domain-containing protein [Bacteroidota bacterium]